LRLALYVRMVRELSPGLCPGAPREMMERR
jgi:hypothetical protein